MFRNVLPVLRRILLRNIFTKYMGSSSCDILIKIRQTTSYSNPNRPVVISWLIQGLFKMGQTKENYVGFWGKVRSCVSPLDSNRSLKTLCYRHTIKFAAGAASSARSFLHPADITLLTLNCASTRLDDRTGIHPLASLNTLNSSHHVKYVFACRKSEY